MSLYDSKKFLYFISDLGYLPFCRCLYISLIPLCKLFQPISFDFFKYSICLSFTELTSVFNSISMTLSFLLAKHYIINVCRII